MQSFANWTVDDVIVQYCDALALSISRSEQFVPSDDLRLCIEVLYVCFVCTALATV